MLTLEGKKYLCFGGAESQDKEEREPGVNWWPQEMPSDEEYARCEKTLEENGKGESYELKLGSHSFIPGFEEQVVGMTAGEEKDINVTFPENYHATELAGAPVVFKVKVHEVKETVLPEKDDEFVKDVSEFDTMAELTGMDISNASMYDGATATAEAMLLAFNNSRKADTVLYSSSLDPKTVDVMRTYAHFHGVRLEEFNSLTTSAEDLKARVDKGDIAGVIVQQPDYYGIIEDFTGYADACHSKKALFVVNSIAADLALLKTPGEWGADLAVGDVQSLGVPMSFGGPTAGYMCSTEKLMRKLPGRIVGKTHDGNGQRVFVLTLQAREQHIRRQKATSNICSNESLMALYVTIYMSLMGKEGLKEAATISYDGAHYLCDKLIATGKARLVYDKPFFNEFLVDIDGRDEFYDRAVEKGFVPGVKVGRSGLLIAVTEQRTKDEADELAALL